MIGWHVQVFKNLEVEIGPIAIQGILEGNPVNNGAGRTYCTKKLPK
jgi:hypothetical protein